MPIYSLLPNTSLLPWWNPTYGAVGVPVEEQMMHRLNWLEQQVMTSVGEIENLRNAVNILQGQVNSLDGDVRQETLSYLT